MKKLIVLVSLVASSFAFAGVDANSSWSQIRKAGFDFDMPKYWVGGNTNVPAEDVCLTADAIRTLTEREVCIAHKYVGGDEGWICSQYENQYLFGSKTVKQTLCRRYAGDNCAEEYEVVVDLAFNYDIPVYKTFRMGDGGHHRATYPSFVKKLVVPACE